MSNLEIIDFETLPKDIYRQIPVSLRSFKTIWTKEELPFDIYHMIEDYITRNPRIDYNIVYDLKYEISKYSDLEILKTKKELVFEYLTNYFQIGINAYPFDPNFYCPLKLYLQKKSDETTDQLIRKEIYNVCDMLTRDLNFKVILKSVDINHTNNTNGVVSYDIIMTVNIDGQDSILTYTESV